MKRFLVLALAFFLGVAPALADAISVPGVPRIGQSEGSFSYPPTASGGGLDPATSAWITAVNTNGGSVSSPRQTIVNTFILCLKSASLYTTLDRYYLLAGENTGSELTDMSANHALAINNGGFTFTANVGAGPSNTASYLDTNSATLTNCVATSCTYGGQDQTATVISTANYAIYGAANGAFTQVSYFKPGAANPANEVEINASSNNGFASTSAKYSWIVTRTNGTTGALYANASTSAPGGAINTTDTGVPGVTFFVGGINQGGSLVAPNTTDVVSSFFIASGWTSTQASAFESCQNAMMTSIGINVH